MKVQLGRKFVEFPGSQLEELKPCNDYLHDRDALQKNLKEHGYLFVRNFHKYDDIIKARNAVLNYVHQQGSDILDTTNYSIKDGILNQRCGLGCVPFMEGRNDITHCEEMKNVIEGSHAYRFFEFLFNEKARTFDFKWLRAMHKNGFTGAHIDRVYMSRGSQDLLTMWTPLGNVSADMGVLAVCEGSHCDKRFSNFHTTYGMCDLEADNISGTGWFTEDPDEISAIGGKWKTADFKAGDVIIFNIKLVHMSTTNLTHFLRLSCDTRWQPQSHSVDSRFVGDCGITKPAYGIYGTEEVQDIKARFITMQQMKEKWGFIKH